MGLRFQRRILVFRRPPGEPLEIRVGFSVGGRGAHVGITARGQRYTSIGLPGTGVSWREYHKPAPIAPRGTAQPRCDLCQPGHVHIHGGFALACLVGFLVWILLLWLRR